MRTLYHDCSARRPKSTYTTLGLVGQALKEGAVVTKVQQPGVSKCRRVATAAPPRCHRLATGPQPGRHRGAALPEASDMLGGKRYDVYYKATLAGLARRPAISSSP